MSSPRRQWKLRGFGRSPWLVLAVAGGMAIGAPILSGAATGDRIVTDRHSGLAIGGFDPVAYFADAAASLGRAELEYRFAGVVWRFRNDGNRAAFIAAPEVYMPRFGGHDPVAVARGAAVPGHPKVWLVANERLYLFHTLESQAAFVLDTERAIAAAERKWPAVALTLSP